MLSPILNLKDFVHTNILSCLCRNWIVMSGGQTRSPNGVLGLLVRKYFPGIVTYKGKREPAYTAAHYLQGEDNEYGNALEHVFHDFWVSRRRSNLCLFRACD
jgi:hypothetical protein